MNSDTGFLFCMSAESGGCADVVGMRFFNCTAARLHNT